ncbi:MAG: CCA tRNA nucleotidyltransferase [Thermogemmata sp.]|nr:CCA tRNA nucleotidyltransferase [Thermogemmata sp.]
MTARQFALKVVRRLQEAGFTAYWAGGCVRDQLLGLEPKDYDVATDARPDQIKALFPRRNEIGAAFGVIQVIGPRGPDGQSLTVEVATFRSDLSYSDGRRPDAVAFSTPQEDALRRDFTINGMFYDPVKGELIDFVGGQADLQARILRAIGNPQERFAEDKLRLLRAARLAARYALTIESQTAAAIRAQADQITVVAPERIADELRKMLSHATRGRGARLLYDLNLIPPLFPELVAVATQPYSGPLSCLGLVSVSGIAEHETSRCDPSTLWGHTVRVIDELPTDAGFPLALAALLHPIGLPIDRRELICGSAQGEGVEGKAFPWPMNAVAVRASQRAEGIAQRLRLSNAEKERLVWLLRYQGALFEAPKQKPHRWRPLLAEVGASDLVALHRAEALANGGVHQEAVDYCAQLLQHWPRERLDPPPLLRGSDLMALGIPPGPEFKRLLDAVRRAQWDEEVQTKEQALALVQQLRATAAHANVPTKPGSAADADLSSASTTSAASKNATE